MVKLHGVKGMKRLLLYIFMAVLLSSFAYADESIIPSDYVKYDDFNTAINTTQWTASNITWANTYGIGANWSTGGIKETNPLNVMLKNNDTWNNNVSCFRMYDSMNTTGTSIMLVYDVPIVGSLFSAIGVRNTESTTHYILNDGFAWKSTNIPRSLGWHDFCLDVSTTRGNVLFYVDKQFVNLSTAVAKVQVTQLGWSNQASMGARWDVFRRWSGNMSDEPIDYPLYNFSVTAFNNITTAKIYNFSANISGLMYYSNVTTGRIETNITNNLSIIHNITVSSADYIDHIYHLYNTSLDLESYLEPEFVFSAIYSNYTTYSGVDYVRSIFYTVNITCPNSTTMPVNLYINDIYMNQTNASCIGSPFYYNGTGKALTEGNLSIYFKVANSSHQTRYFYWDLYDPNPYVNFTVNGSFWNNPQAEVTEICYDTITPMIQYNLTFNSNPLFFGNKTANSSQINTSAFLGGVNTAIGQCWDFFGMNSTSYPYYWLNMTFNIYDEATLALVVENISFQWNNEFMQRATTTTTGTVLATLSEGQYTITAGNDNYSLRQFIRTINNETENPMSLYLAKSTDKVVFTIKNVGSGQPIEDASISMYRFINDSWTVVETHESDVTGKAQFTYYKNVEYRFFVSATDYISKEFTLNPILFSEYDVPLEKSPSSFQVPDYVGVSIGYSPRMFYANKVNNFTFFIHSPAGVLISYGYNITYIGGSSANSGTSSVGEAWDDSFTIGNTPIGAYLNLTYYYTTTQSGYKSFSFRYEIVNVEIGGNTTFIANRQQTYGMGIFERVLLSTIIILIVGGLIGLVAGGFSGLGIALLLMGYFAYIGFVPWWAIYISLFVGFIILAWRSGI